MFCIQVLIYLLFFTAAIMAVVAKGPVGGLFFYPKPVQQRVLELGLTDETTVRKRKALFFTEVSAPQGKWLIFLPRDIKIRAQHIPPGASRITLGVASR
jgi:hypothetical protein